MTEQVSGESVTGVPVAEPGARRVPTTAPRLHLSRAERAAHGKAARASAPLDQHALFAPTDLRADPVELLERQATSRVPELVPIRYGRMLTSPFAFYRGAALVMAADLAATPVSGLRAQLCGDAHLSNFGVFASPERRLIFDANDFDETLPGPFEWDVKRLAASFELAGRENGFTSKQRALSVVESAASYRRAMGEFAAQTNLDVWYAHLHMKALLKEVTPLLKPAPLRRAEEQLAKARTRDRMQAFRKLTRMVDGRPRIVSDPPLVVPVAELFPHEDADQLTGQVEALVVAYAQSLPADHRHLLEQYRLDDVARKVVGVGSVGTRAWILLFEGIDGQDPIFLQAKEAQASVLEEYAGASGYTNHGQRVVVGQHLMQAYSDIFLGWQRTNGLDGVDRDYYVRQLRDWKGSVVVERMSPESMAVYARLCGWTLARAHARSGDRVAIAAYLGRKDTFERAVAEFSRAYADQTDRDFAALEAAEAAGRVAVRRGL